MTSEKRFSVDRAGRQILSREVVSRRHIGSLSEADVASFVTDPSVRFFVNRDRDTLDEIVGGDISGFWETELQNHIASDENSSLNDFENGYMFLAELWKGYGGQKIVVLYYQH